jgi:peptidoglycan/LPS O-acetylase OafA/YrhL
MIVETLIGGAPASVGSGPVKSMSLSDTVDDRAAGIELPESRAEVADPFRRSYSNALHLFRGIAAASVFINHYIDFLSQPALVLAPLGLIDRGLSAVALFFVMSGAVLAISLDRFQWSVASYAAYAVRRAFRLLPMIVVSCSIGYLYARFQQPMDQASPVLAPEFFRFYRSAVSWTGLLFAWTGLYAALNPPMWSIYIEIVASAVLPIYVTLSRRLSGSIALCGFLLAVSFATSGLDGRLERNHWPVYMVDFAAGLLACHLGRLASTAVNRIPGVVYGLLVCALFLALMNGRSVFQFADHGHAPGNLFDTVVSLALVVVLIERRGIQGRTAIASFLGDTSYPVYLLHWPLLCVLLATSVRLFGDSWIQTHAALWQVSMLVLAAVCVWSLAWLSFHFIERPAIRAGRRMALWVANLQSGPSRLRRTRAH